MNIFCKRFLGLGLLFTAVVIFFASASFAQPYGNKQTHPLYEVTDSARVAQNPALLNADYLPYPVTDENPSSIPALTPSPDGYKPFYISHYGRHGSRWLIGTSYYQDPVKFLRKAQADGMLTPLGEEVLRRMVIVEQAARGRDGELTKLGARQHREIAGRMYENFKEVFEGNVAVDAKSTVIIRCILSMEAFCQRLKELNKDIAIANDASYHDMYYMNYQDPHKYFRELTSAPVAKTAIDEYRKSLLGHRGEAFAARILKDTAYFTRYNKNEDNYEDYVEYSAMALLYDLAQQTVNLPNTDCDIRFDDIVGTEDLHAVYKYRNFSSYRYAGFTPVTENKAPYRQTNLLRNIIEQADRHIASGERGADLRFGHDSNLLPLCSLMNIDGAGVSEADRDRVADVWAMYYYIPKAANLQFIFYRNENKADAPILVKVLLNEHEATLPVETDMFPYYEWEKVKEYYRPVIEGSPLQEYFYVRP